MFKFTVNRPLIAMVMTAALAACGGGGGGGSGVGAGVGAGVGGGAGGAPGAAAPATTDIPASALASVDGLIAFMNQLIDTGTNDTSEPIVLGDASLPVDDTI